MVHGQSEAKDAGIFVVAIDVLPVGQPDEVSLQLLSLGLVALLMLELPQLPLLRVLEVDLGSHCHSKDSEENCWSLHGALEESVPAAGDS